MDNGADFVKMVIERIREKETTRREKQRMCNKQWIENHRDRHNANVSKNNAKLRLQCLQHYCGSEVPFCQCPGCRETTIQFLTIDHINGGGTQHFKEVGGGTNFYNWLKRNNYPDGFQVLCMNCNHAKGHYGKCPHKERAELIEIALTFEG